LNRQNAKTPEEEEEEEEEEERRDLGALAAPDHILGMSERVCPRCATG
jgi:hypothetical protein